MIRNLFNSFLSSYNCSGYDNNLTPAPHEYGSCEDLLSRAIYKREMSIALPKDAVRLATIQFIISCPETLWHEYNCPKSLLIKRSIRDGAKELLGHDVSSIITGLWRYYGSMNVFDELRTHYNLDQDNLVLRRKR